MKIYLKSIVSSFHDDNQIEEALSEFNERLYKSLKEEDIELVEKHSLADLTISYIKSGGTENIFKESFEAQAINLLLTTDMHNSLPAGLEIHAYLTEKGYNAEILHGDPELIAKRIKSFLLIILAKEAIKKEKLGVIGKPSDWLIASDVDYERIKETLGIELIDIPLDEFYRIWDEFSDLSTSTSYDNEETIANYDRGMVEEANRIYKTLKVIINKYGLTSLTLRCFDLVNEGCGTGCLALSYLNSENIVSGCEGDIPAAISMIILNRLTNQPVFMANPSRIDIAQNSVLFAHCTLPWNFCTNKELDTHFETNLGIGVRGYIEKNEITVFKLNSRANEFYVSHGQIVHSGNEDVLCRTQITTVLDKDVEYFLQNPLGNHHLVIKGHYQGLIDKFFEVL